MLRRLFQWLKKWLQRFFGSPQTRSINTPRRNQVVDSLPELTNADLELLFNQLLEGVYQARGRQWVLQYLQRMEHRITEERWIDWLLIFGEKLLLSPAPNHQLATRMVQLGELDIGKIGELAYDIGIRLLTRNLATQNEADEEYEEYEQDQLEVESINLEETLLNTPGQELIRNLGERLWDYEEEEAEVVTPPRKLNAIEEAWTGNLEAVMYEDEEELGFSAAEYSFWMPSPEDAISNLCELFGEETGVNHQIAIISEAITAKEAIETTATDEEHAITHLFDIVREAETEAIETTATDEEHDITYLFDIFREAETEAIETTATDEEHDITYLFDIVKEAETEAIETTATDEDHAITHLFDILREPEVGEAETTVAADVPPPTTNEDDAIMHLFDLLRESDTDEIVTTPAANALTPTVEETWEQSLANLEPKVADTLDELLVRLDQSTNLVQGLATELAVYRSTPKAIVQPESNQAQALFYQGLQQGKTGDLLGAIAFYEQAIELQPDYYEYWFNRGLTLFHLEQYAAAIASYDRALELKPDFYKAWYNRGGTLGELGEFDAAVFSFEQATKIKPEAAESWSSKGLALLKLGQIWEAIASYDQALHLQPQDQENWYYRGIALAVDEQYAEAIASYDKALEIQPDYYEVWIDRGVVLFNLGQWSEAIASWDHALSIQSDFYLAWYNRGVALDNLGLREEAIISYGKAIAIKPDFHLAWYNQAVALFYLGRYVEAIASYDGALQIQMDYWEAWIGRSTSVGNLVDPDALATLFTTLTTTNSALKQTGYAGKLASLEAGLEYVRPDTHPEGWGRLHLAIANTYYESARKYTASRYEWQQAVVAYNQALLTLTREDFPQLHLEVLQSLVKVHIGLGEIPAAHELHEYGIDLLQQLLTDSTCSDENKKQLALKFAGFGQLAVDLAVSYGDLVEAWEIAEQGKNACLTWLLFGWHEEIYSPHYTSVQQLLNPTTAIIYWHISPTALHTFILKDSTPSPILLFTPIQDIGAIHFGATPMHPHELPLPEAVRRLIAFEDWLENWHQKYQDYRSQAQDPQNISDHPWQVEMEQELLNLKDILNISTIVQELEGITQLVLVPHRDLHRLPLHTLFQFSSDLTPEFPSQQSNLTITYLPSVQIGLTLKSEPQWDKHQQLLLNIEHPQSTGYQPLKFAKLQSEIVSQMFTNANCIPGTQANKNTVTQSLKNDYYHILNFLGYVINNYQEPKKSELILADEDTLTLEEICQHTLESYYLITLSACETINSYNPVNSEYVGFVSGLLTRGVSQVVSTLWTVESFASALLLIEFYRRMQPDKSAATALAEATAWLRELTAEELTNWYENLLHNLHPDELRIRAYVATQQYRSSKMSPEQKPYSHPYYWAAFTITGKPN
jgi:CHAT domain-containing protein/tetratricopeptide (TPR) repeat protein